MSQDNLDNISDESSAEESSLITDLRKQLRAANAQVKRYEARDEDFNRVKKESTEQLLVAAGFPGMLDDVLEKVEGIPSQEDVDAFLEARGLKAKGDASDASPEGEESATDGNTQSVEQVADLGQQVASAAQRTPITDLDAKINAANSQDELDAVMAKAGLSG